MLHSEGVISRAPHPERARLIYALSLCSLACGPSRVQADGEGEASETGTGEATDGQSEPTPLPDLGEDGSLDLDGTIWFRAEGAAQVYRGYDIGTRELIEIQDGSFASFDGSHAVAVAQDFTVSVADRSGSILSTLPVGATARFASNGHVIYSQGLSSYFRVAAVGGEAQPYDLAPVLTAQPSSTVLPASDGRSVFVVSEDNRLERWNVAGEQAAQTWSTRLDPSTPERNYEPFQVAISGASFWRDRSSDNGEEHFVLLSPEGEWMSRSVVTPVNAALLWAVGPGRFADSILVQDDQQLRLMLGDGAVVDVVLDGQLSGRARADRRDGEHIVSVVSDAENSGFLLQRVGGGGSEFVDWDDGGLAWRPEYFGG